MANKTEISEKQREGKSFLRKTDTGILFCYTDALAKRPDMVECDKKGKRLNAVFVQDGAMPTVEIDIGGKLYDIPENLKDVVGYLVDAASKKEDTDAEKEIAALTKKLNAESADTNQLTKDKLALTSANEELTGKIAGLEKEADERIEDLKKGGEINESLEKEVTDLKAALKKKK